MSESNNLDTNNDNVINDIVEQLNKVHGISTNVTHKINQLLTKLKETTQELADTKENEKKLKGEIDKLTGSKKVFETEINKDQSIIEQLRKKAEELSKKVGYQQEIIDKMNIGIDSSGNPEEVKKLKQEIFENVSKYQQCKKEYDNMLSKKEGDTTALQDIQKRLDQRNQDYEKLQRQFFNTNNKLFEVKKKLDKLQEEVNGQSNILKDVTESNETTPITDLLGGRRKKTKKYFSKQKSRKNLDKVAKKWGVKNCNKFKTKDQIKKCLSLLLVYKYGGRKYISKKSQLQIIAKNLDIKYENLRKKELEKVINKSIKNISYKDIV